MPKPIEIQPLTYVDTDDRSWQEFMQEPQTQDYIRNTFLDIPPEDWPDQIFLADLPQVPDEQIDAPIKQKVGRCEGPLRNRGDVKITPTDADVTFFRPVSTRFVRVVLGDGREMMERWNSKKHGEWDKIPDTGVTPAELIEQLYGFGETEVNQGEQLKNARKKKASKSKWEAKNHPKPHIHGHWK